MKIDYIRAFSSDSSIPAVALQTSPRLTAASIRFMAKPPLPHRAQQPRRSFPCSHTDFADAYPVSSGKVCFIQATRRRIKTGSLSAGYGCRVSAGRSAQPPMKPSRCARPRAIVLGLAGSCPRELYPATIHENQPKPPDG